jgi:hypothetical protein
MSSICKKITFLVRIYELVNDNYYNIPTQSTTCILRNVHKTLKQNETLDQIEADSVIISKLCECLFITQNKYYARFYEVKIITSKIIILTKHFILFLRKLIRLMKLKYFLKIQIQIQMLA